MTDLLVTLLLLIPDVAFSCFWIWFINKAADDHFRESDRSKKNRILKKYTMRYEDPNLQPEKNSQGFTKLILTFVLALPVYLAVFAVLMLIVHLTGQLETVGPYYVVVGLICIFWFLSLLQLLLFTKILEWTHQNAETLYDVLRILLFVPCIWLGIVVQYVPFLLFMVPLRILFG